MDDLLFDMLYDFNFEMIFWKYFHSKKDFYAPLFDMIYDYRFEMRTAKFSYTKIFSSGIHNTIY